MGSMTDSPENVLREALGKVQRGLANVIEHAEKNGLKPGHLVLAWAEFAHEDVTAALSYPGEYGSYQEDDAYRERMQAAEAETPERCPTCGSGGGPTLLDTRAPGGWLCTDPCHTSPPPEIKR